MPKTEIRQLTLEEAAHTTAQIGHYSLSSSPPARKPEDFIEKYQETANHTHYYGLFEDGIPAACAAAGPMVQNVRGKLVSMSGVFMVATHPAHRLKGYSYQVLKTLLKNEHEAGHAFSCLYPFRESFYERLGYASWQVPIEATLDPRGLYDLTKQGWGTQIELLEFIPNEAVFREFIKEYQQEVHGVARFVKNIPPSPEYNQLWMALSKIDGQIDGLMLYKLTGDAPTKYKFEASRFYYRSQESLYQLLGWIGRHIDQTDQAILQLPAFEHPHTWHHDMNVSFKPNWIPPMGRVLDIQSLNGIPVGPGSFTARIIDPICPWNEGVWQFSAQEDAALSVTPAQQADFELTIQGLSALVYGVAHPESFAVRGWGSPTAKDTQAMLQLFPPAIPHMHAYF